MLNVATVYYCGLLYEHDLRDYVMCKLCTEQCTTCTFLTFSVCSRSKLQVSACMLPARVGNEVEIGHVQGGGVGGRHPHL